MSHLIGYARVSTRDQNPASQVSELEAAGCVRVYVDHGQSSRTQDRPQWAACLDHLLPGDTLVFRALDRIAGSELMAIETIMMLGERGVSVRSLTEPGLNVDVSTPMGRAVLGIMAVLAQLRFGQLVLAAMQLGDGRLRPLHPLREGVLGQAGVLAVLREPTTECPATHR